MIFIFLCILFLYFHFVKWKVKKNIYIYLRPFITCRILEIKIENYQSHSELKAVRDKKGGTERTVYESYVHTGLFTSTNH